MVETTTGQQTLALDAPRDIETAEAVGAKLAVAPGTVRRWFGEFTPPHVRRVSVGEGRRAVRWRGHLVERVKLDDDTRTRTNLKGRSYGYVLWGETDARPELVVRAAGTPAQALTPEPAPAPKPAAPNLAALLFARDVSAADVARESGLLPEEIKPIILGLKPAPRVMVHVLRSAYGIDLEALGAVSQVRRAPSAPTPEAARPVLDPQVRADLGEVTALELAQRAGWYSTTKKARPHAAAVLAIGRQRAEYWEEGTHYRKRAIAIEASTDETRWAEAFVLLPAFVHAFTNHLRAEYQQGRETFTIEGKERDYHVRAIKHIRRSRGQ